MYLPTPMGLVQVDVLEVSDWELENLPEDRTDRLHVTAHAWGAQTASPVRVRASGLSAEQDIEVTTKIAEPGPLVAMKLQAVMNRPAAKEGTDLLDIVRLVLDPITGPAALDQLATGDDQLASDAQDHVGLWFVTNSERSLRRIRAVGGADVDLDTLSLVGALLSESLRR
ncbi:hypothetical protein [Jiangella alba]|uniref:hypothetical protein n=1 Tax=Jiangella alba TaxID=561176 RepID=UPI000ACA665D|nr:hypothetical protein [Jiangella alba]